MTTQLKRVENPELFFGFVAPIGANIDQSVAALQRSLLDYKYNPILIRVTEVFSPLQEQLKLKNELLHTPLESRYESHIAYGDALRAHFKDDAFLALTSVEAIVVARSKCYNGEDIEYPQSNAFIVRQFKRKEEIDLFRSIYGKLFFQISVYSKRDSRVDNLSRKIGSSHYSSEFNKFRAPAEYLVQIDENEAADEHGQRVSDVFHEADFIIDTDIGPEKVQEQMDRFVALVFGSNTKSPTKMEYGLYTAKSASLRTLDLSRQVGAAIFSQEGEITTIGTNEVPKGRGGTYWSDDDFDDREHKRAVDSNEKRKKEILGELCAAIKQEYGVEIDPDNAAVRGTQFMDALEYGRVVHAEMSAICDAARLGRPIKGGKLYCTTFPCHMCAKHIVASGLAEVVFLEPYPKSLASDLHSDSIRIEGQSRGTYEEYPSVLFRHFHGVSPRRYRDLFERQRRKDKASGKVEEWVGGAPRCIVDLKIPLYLQIETKVISSILLPYLSKAGIEISKIFRAASGAEAEILNEEKNP